MTTKADTAPAIELSGLTKRFRRTLAVDSLSLQVARGSTFGLIGPNGAGKTTTIKMLLGMVSATAGEARVLGVDVFADPVRVKQRVGYVPETQQIYRWMRVSEVIGFCRSLYQSWSDRTCREMLDLFALDPGKKVKHLSKGMLVKLSLLVAVSHDAELLVLDEPMAGLDPLAREEFLDGVLRTICDRPPTVLFSTHTMDDIQRLADTVGILYEGRLLVHGKLDALLANTKRIKATIADGSRPEHPPADTLWQRVDGRQWLVTVANFSPEKVQEIRAENALDHVEVVDIGLEDLFKDLVRGKRAAR